jgi:hypothetical protein
VFKFELSKFLFIFAFGFSSIASAATSGITYQGRIVKPDGTALEDSAVQFKIQIRSPDSGNCLMYEEVQILDMQGTGGLFGLTINDGSGSRTDSSGYNIDQIFANKGSFAFSTSDCAQGSTYAPNPSDGRRLSVYFKDQTVSQWEPIPTQNLNFIPQAIEAKQVGGYQPGDLLRVDKTPAQTVAAFTFADYTNLVALLAGTSAQYLSTSTTQGAALPTYASNPGAPSSGSLWYDSTLKQVKFFDGSTIKTFGTASGAVGVSSILTGTGLTGGPITASGTISIANSGVDTPQIASSAITDPKIASGTITGDKFDPALTISTTGNITAAQVSTTSTSVRSILLYDPSGPGLKKVTLAAPASLPMNYSLALPASAPAANQIMQSDALGNLSWTNISAGVTSFLSGSAAAPGWAVTGNANTGLFSPASNTISMSAGGIEGLRVNTSGGATDYVAVTPGGVSSTQISTAGTDANVDLKLVPKGAGNTIIANGNVGIGTTTPSNMLSLDGQAARTIAMEREATAATAGNGLTIQAGGVSSGANNLTGGSLNLSGGISTGNAGSVINFQVAGQGYPAGGTADNAPVTVGTILQTGEFQSTYHSVNASGWLNGLGVQNDINNAQPAVLTLAHERGSVALQNADAIGEIDFKGLDSTNNKLLMNQIRTNVTNATHGSVQTSMAFQTMANSVATDQLTILGSNVGIGTTNPLARLQIAAGSSVPSGAPLMFTTGSLLATPASGAVEYDGNFLYITNASGARQTIATSGGTSSATTFMAAAGTASAPSHSFTGDSSTGMYDSAVGTLGFSTAGVIAITAASNTVNIPLTTPSFNYFTGALVLGGGLGVGGTINGNGSLSTSVSNNAVYSSSSAGLQYPNSGSSHSIGNNSPTGNSYSDLRMSVRNSNSNLQYGYIGITSASGALQYTPAMMFGLTTGATAYQEQMRIDSTGYVGIGTTAPNARLDVNGKFILEASTPGNGYAGFAAPASMATSTIWTLPAADGASGTMLSTNGAGILSWATAAAAPTTFLPGSAAAPGWALSGNTNTGLFSAASNTISLSAGGYEAIRAIASASTPTDYMTVTPGGVSTTTLGVAGTDASVDLVLSPKGSGNITTSNPVLITNATGTSNTTTGALIVTGGIAAGGRMIAGSGISANYNSSASYPSSSVVRAYPVASSIGAINYQPLNGSAAMMLLAPSTASGVQQNAYLAAVSSGAGYSPSIVIGLQNAAAGYQEMLRVDTTGNVGVGTTGPAVKMDVAGEVKIGNTAVGCSATTKGAIRYNNASNVLEYCNSTSWTLVQASACTNATPAAFTFTAVANASISTLYTSNITQITGINCAVTTTISGTNGGAPAYQICSDNVCGTVLQSWTTGSSSITTGQYIQIQQTSSGTGGVTTDATMIVGGGASTWNVTANGDCTLANPVPGTLCADGSIYAGKSPDGNVKMYTQRCDLGQTWNGSTCAGSRFTLTFATASTVTGYTNYTTGKANTAGLNALVDGGQPYQAVSDCVALNEDGHTDWYLPAENELSVVYGNYPAIGNFQGSGYYWSSTDANFSNGFYVRFADGYNGATSKTTVYSARCVRR